MYRQFYFETAQKNCGIVYYKCKIYDVHCARYTVQVANVEVTGEEWEEELRESFTESGLFPGTACNEESVSEPFPGMYKRKCRSPDFSQVCKKESVSGLFLESSNLAISELKCTFALTGPTHYTYSYYGDSSLTKNDFPTILQ
jgi:hypothetical protein